MHERNEIVKYIHRKIKEEEDYSKILENGPKRLRLSKYLIAVPAFLLLCDIVYNLVIGSSYNLPLMMWIVGSFAVYMVFFFLMMLPSLGTDSKQSIFGSDFRNTVKEFLKLLKIIETVHKNKFTIIECFWKAYIINTKPMVKGFTLLFISDIVCATILLASSVITPIIYVILTAQIAAILILYIRISRAVPGEPGFFSAVPLQNDLVKNFSIKKLVAAVAALLSIAFVIIIMVGAMMLPNVTLIEYIDGLPYVPTGFPLLMAFIIAFQVLFVRYIQGVDSRKLMMKLNKNHRDVLENDLLPRAMSADKSMLSDLKREVILFSMNKLIVQEFFYRFPAYVLMPNFFIILDPLAREILNEKGEEITIIDSLENIL